MRQANLHSIHRRSPGCPRRAGAGRDERLRATVAVPNTGVVIPGLVDQYEHSIDIELPHRSGRPSGELNRRAAHAGSCATGMRDLEP
jgi:hypothetical protein